MSIYVNQAFQGGPVWTEHFGLPGPIHSLRQSLQDAQQRGQLYIVGASETVDQIEVVDNDYTDDLIDPRMREWIEKAMTTQRQETWDVYLIDGPNVSIVELKPPQIQGWFQKKTIVEITMCKYRIRMLQ